MHGLLFIPVKIREGEKKWKDGEKKKKKKFKKLEGEMKKKKKSQDTISADDNNDDDCSAVKCLKPTGENDIVALQVYKVFIIVDVFDFQYFSKDKLQCGPFCPMLVAVTVIRSHLYSCLLLIAVVPVCVCQVRR